MDISYNVPFIYTAVTWFITVWIMLHIIACDLNSLFKRIEFTNLITLISCVSLLVKSWTYAFVFFIYETFMFVTINPFEDGWGFILKGQLWTVSLNWYLEIELDPLLSDEMWRDFNNSLHYLVFWIFFESIISFMVIV